MNKMLFVLLVVSFSFGQNNIVEYKIIPNTTNEAFRGLIISKSQVESYLKLVSFSLIYNQEQMKFYANKIPKIVNEDIESSLLISNIQGIYHRKNKTDDLYVEIEKYGNKENFIITKKFITDWNITNEKKVICGYDCIKATCMLKVDYGDNEINTLYPLTAWFCPEIKYSYGPKGYGNLPGLILGVEENFLIYQAEKIYFDNQSEIISMPTNRKVISESKMYDLMGETIKTEKNKCQSNLKKEEMIKTIDIKI